MRSLLLTVMTIVTAFFVVPAQPAAATPTECSALEVVAHRGYHPSRIDENTLRAFQESINHGWSIETDVWADAQGQLWVFHDRRTLRSTGTDGFIDKMTTAQVDALRYKKAGSPLPTLEEAMALWAQYPATKVYIEVKQQFAVDGVVALIRGAARVPSTWITSQQSYTHNIAPEIRLQLKNFTATPPAPETLPGKGIDSITLRGDMFTEEVVDSYHAEGVSVHYANSNATLAWRRTIESGADAQLTDQPIKLEQFCPSALELPSISGFDPVSAAPGATVTITGADFYDVSAVRFGSVRAVFTVVSPSKITATVPDMASASVPLQVTNPNGTTQSSVPFTVTSG